MRWFPPHVPVGARRARVARVSDELRRNGVDVQPVHIEGRSIARSFWGRRWCHHLESCSDFENRLPRGRAYVRNGSVCHLDVHAGGVDAMVVGIGPLSRRRGASGSSGRSPGRPSGPSARAGSDPSSSCSRGGCPITSCASSPIPTAACSRNPARLPSLATVPTGR